MNKRADRVGIINKPPAIAPALDVEPPPPLPLLLGLEPAPVLVGLEKEKAGLEDPLLPPGVVVGPLPPAAEDDPAILERSVCATGLDSG